MRAASASSNASPLNADAQAVLHALGHDEAAPDLLSERSGLSAARLQTALLHLEMAGRITFLSCGRIAPYFGGGDQQGFTSRLESGETR